jgi:hypothetical protein
MAKKKRKNKPKPPKSWETSFLLTEENNRGHSGPILFPPYTSIAEPDSEARRGVILLHAIEEGKRLGLMDKDLDANEALLKLGIDPAAAEAAWPAYYQFLAESGAFEGQHPTRKQEPTLSTETKTQATMAIRDYIFSHPGCVDTSGPRAYYDNGYKLFILSLLGPGGDAEGATTAEAVKITGLSAATLSAFRRQAREGKLDKDAQDNNP